MSQRLVKAEKKMCLEVRIKPFHRKCNVLTQNKKHKYRKQYVMDVWMP